ncbi:TetR/AcrR family transcriptional regulator [Xanthomonas citri pv. durantae]|uniref:TetR/AcrR family transcriptional regulator n=1 Tax=Xanthomonas citri pv. durantae TaxID=487862 RepID=A0A9X6BLS9_XANCI|nr:TetR/AcrR family transcriptional regulator [Xanthomonas citri]QRD56548.1 TetR/AcrR family transcriptional regulator [Xanthomonas citri pv. citri]UVG57022.1 TetR/AcrR family transcriptional regulator [Xanthomonas citri pv. durantae]CEH47454.1 Transcriptional regulator, TetR-family [Xanthomonas citri pv. citri]CEH93956.1 Transcriptional regulator, TetR-family [Xanthomonas citri pv. citri]
MAATGTPVKAGPPTPEDILDAAEWCFLHTGVSDTSVALIAARARCARSLVNYHFPSFCNILDEVLQRGRCRLRDHLLRVHGSQRQLLPSLRSALQLWLNDVIHNDRVRAVQEILAFRCDLGRLPAHILDQQIKESAEVLALLRSIARDAKKAHELREDVCAESWASILGLLVSGAVRLCLMQRSQEARIESWRAATRAVDAAFMLAAPVRAAGQVPALENG